MKRKTFYEAPTVDAVELLIENRILDGSQIRNNVQIEIMDVDDAELDW